MKRWVLFFLSVMMITGIGCSGNRETEKPVVARNHPAKLMVLQSRYDENNHVKEKKLLKKKIKKLDTVINSEFDHLKDWVNNVGEAVDMME